jgi:hypothetical protein
MIEEACLCLLQHIDLNLPLPRPQNKMRDCCTLRQ